MKKIIGVVFFISPILAAAMGNPFRAQFYVNPYPTGVREDCSHIYDDGGRSLSTMVNTYDVTCLVLAKSVPIEVGPECHYDDYKQTQKYKYPQFSIQTNNGFNKLNEELMKSAKFGQLNIQKGRDYFSQTYYNPTGNLELELFQGKYCQQAIPKDVTQAFAPHVDVPAKVISFWDEDYITSRWKSELPQLAAKHPEADFNTLIELNLKGHQIWNKMIECAGGNEEMARANYYLAKFNCAGGVELKEEIKNYMQSVKIFFSTSFVKPLKVNIEYKFQMVQALNGKLDAVTSSYSSFPTFHPLFEQAMLQILIDVFPVGSSDRISVEYINRKLGISKERPDSPLLQVIAQYDSIKPNGDSPMGLWPSISHSVFSQVQRTRLKVLQTVMGSDIRIQEFKGAPAGFLQKLPDFYDINRARLTDEMRALSKRYSL